MSVKNHPGQAALRTTLFSGIILISAVAVAGSPLITFDVNSVVGCRDVTPASFADEYPGEKLIEAELLVTTRLARGNLGDVHELHYEVRSPEKRLRVLEYWPVTRYESDVEGTIEVTKTSEEINSAGASLAGTVKIPDLPVKASVTPSANLGNSEREAVSETYQKVAPRRTTLVSGTMDQGYGIFIKRTRSTQFPFEGTETILCRFVVPEDWQGDWLEIRCRAEGTRKRTFNKSRGVVGSHEMIVGLHLLGDRQARQAAARLAKAQTTADEWERRERGRSDLAVAADRISNSFESLACSMRLKKCNKNRQAAPSPQQQFAAARRSLAELAGDLEGPLLAEPDDVGSPDDVDEPVLAARDADGDDSDAPRGGDVSDGDRKGETEPALVGRADRT
ncbi:MAG: hypothetical protein DWQ31_16430 [Planctomycetota bacterium]|nr:MAG: hypothetical protein DWQ31_16430 [Planctomycetota bacterium]REJ96340.1 MAG: hypothetical protein DWQ35_04755 [Planctomycetota bacterium]REK18721.1 MAG: hypothetical protein DWQ42_19245 [Planctomycetota bacterium]REK49107.1 MAG: hypothetical protein DWQ46_00960 [Planctomycetota bacterium]